MCIAAVLPEAVIEGGEGGDWNADFGERWNIGRNQNGGVVLAMASTALAAAVGKPHPLSVTGHYLRPVAAGPGIVRTSAVRLGATTSTGAAGVWQDGKERLRVTGTYGDHDARAAAAPAGYVLDSPAPPIPAPDDCADLFAILAASPAGARTLTRSLRNFEIRVAPGTGWGPDGCGRPALSGWIRLRDAGTVTASQLIAFADAFPPTLMSRTELGWLPTLELTVHVLACPVPDEPWLRAELRTPAAAGLVGEDGELWDASGRLVARFRQLAMQLPGDRPDRSREVPAGTR